MLAAMFLSMPLMAQRQRATRKDVPLDSIRMSDPAILADKKTGMYYMTGTGGMMSVHSHYKDARGRTTRIPHLFEVDLSGDKLIVKTTQ